jgi:nitrile hydratase subunit beta
MNGIHDMGGMHGMGPIEHEKNEPVFHARWEGRIFALRRAMRPWPKYNAKAGRYHIELIPPEEQLRLSYYARFVPAFSELLVEGGFVTTEEILKGKPARHSPKVVPPLQAEQVPAFLAKGAPSRRDVVVAPQFKTGQSVRARNINPIGHTRLPRYARGKLGTVDRDHGVFIFPDTNVGGLGEKPQHVYSVRFAARELWGAQASPRDSVYIDLWDDYLEPV